MKTLNFTYDVIVIEKGHKITGETCMNIEMMDYIANNLLTTGKSGLANKEIERIIKNSESLKGRHYIPESIKHIEEVEEVVEEEI